MGTHAVFVTASTAFGPRTLCHEKFNCSHDDCNAVQVRLSPSPSPVLLDFLLSLHTLPHFISICLYQLVPCITLQYDGKARDGLLQVLVDHATENVSYTHSCVLQCWKQLAEANRIPLRFLLKSVLAMAAERLREKSVAVKKSALRLCNALLLPNPFGASLDIKPFQVRQTPSLSTRHRHRHHNRRLL